VPACTIDLSAGVDQEMRFVALHLDYFQSLPTAKNTVRSPKRLQGRMGIGLPDDTTTGHHVLQESVREGGEISHLVSKVGDKRVRVDVEFFLPPDILRVLAHTFLQMLLRGTNINLLGGVAFCLVYYKGMPANIVVLAWWVAGSQR
jgi:hypothetical protein